MGKPVREIAFCIITWIGYIIKLYTIQYDLIISFIKLYIVLYRGFYHVYISITNSTVKY